MNCVFLCDISGVMAKPWANAGYTCHLVDVQHPPGITKNGNIIKYGMKVENFTMPNNVKFAIAFPPSDFKTNKPPRPKNIRNAMIPWKVKALNEASAPIASISVPKTPSKRSAVIPPIITNANQNKNSPPPITAEPANITSKRLGDSKPRKLKINSSNRPITSCLTVHAI